MKKIFYIIKKFVLTIMTQCQPTRQEDPCYVGHLPNADDGITLNLTNKYSFCDGAPGFVTVNKVDNNLVVTFHVDDNWVIIKTLVYVSSDPPGCNYRRNAFSHVNNGPTGCDGYVFPIPANCCLPQTVFIAAAAKVRRVFNNPLCGDDAQNKQVAKAANYKYKTIDNNPKANKKMNKAMIKKFAKKLADGNGDPGNDWLSCCRPPGCHWVEERPLYCAQDILVWAVGDNCCRFKGCGYYFAVRLDPVPALVLNKTGTAVGVGEQAVFTITVSNPTDFPAEGVHVTDVLPSPLLGFDWTVIGVSAGVPLITPSATSQILNWSIGELLPHQTATVILSSSTNNVHTIGEYPNTAVLTYTDGPTLESTANLRITDGNVTK